MVLHYRTDRGTDIYALAVPNLWGGEGWDLGPTWCYLIASGESVLIDTGRFGNYEVLKSQLEVVGKHLDDIDVIIVTHCHEDHDGNLPEVMAEGHHQLWAHPIYQSMISYFPDIDDGANHPELPGSCRYCVMPEEFYRNCIPYHRKRSQLKIDWMAEDGTVSPVENLRIVYSPGHTPDSICIILDDQVIFTGDTVLPGITPHPSMEDTYRKNRRILPEEYCHRNDVYGLNTYLRSLQKLMLLDNDRFEATFPGHRLFYNGEFNLIHHTRERTKEIIGFHSERCSDIIRIVREQPGNLDYIADHHFQPSQLAGSGRLMARNELMAHIEVMESCGDVHRINGKANVIEHTGSYNFLNTIQSFLSSSRNSSA